MSVAAKRMTRGGSDTDLEPSEEFPILFGLLTAPMTNSSSAGGGAGSIPKSSSAFLSKYFRKAEPAPNEPDSSALSDDDVCMSDEDDDDDEDDYTSYTDTDDEDDGGNNNNDEAVVSSNSHDHHYHHHCPNNPFGLASEELPSSTTVDDEDYDDIIHASSRTQGMDIRLLPSNPLTKALKRSYRLMNSGESRSAGNVHDDTEDQVGFCCKNYDLENLGEIERNRLASQPSKGSSPRRMSAEDHLAAFLHLPNKMKHSPHNGFSNEDDDINSEILLVQPAKKLRPADEPKEDEGDSSRRRTSPVDHETSSSSLNPTSEMCAGFSFCNEKLRPTTTTRQKVAQGNPDFVNNARSIKSFNNTTVAVVPHNTSMNALSFNNNDSNNNATATTIPKKQQVEQVHHQHHHPTDHDHLTAHPYPLEKIINNNNNTATTITSNTSLKDSQQSLRLLHNNNNKGPSQKDHDLELPGEEEVINSEMTTRRRSSSNSHSPSQSYKCIHCDLTFEERQEWASHTDSCINN